MSPWITKLIFNENRKSFRSFKNARCWSSKIFIYLALGGILLAAFVPYMLTSSCIDCVRMRIFYSNGPFFVQIAHFPGLFWNESRTDFYLARSAWNLVWPFTIILKSVERNHNSFHKWRKQKLSITLNAKLT